VIDGLLGLAGERFNVLRLPRRWDGKNLSNKGTLTSGFRVIEGSQPGVGQRWATYVTTVSKSHLWIARNSMYVAEFHHQHARPPGRRELVSLDPDFVVVPVVARSGARLDWALRQSAMDAVIALLDVGPEGS
jgi:hypothetical protein